jgi:hypothetical protein
MASFATYGLTWPPLAVAALASLACGEKDEPGVMQGSPRAALAAIEDVKINEVKARSQGIETGAGGDWIELANLKNYDFPLGGWGIADTPVSAPAYVFSSDAFVPRFGVVLLCADGLPDDSTTSDEECYAHLPFRLSGQNEGVWLRRADGSKQDEVAWLTPLQWPGRDYSIARYPDGTGEWWWCPHPTPGERNSSDCVVYGRKASDSVRKPFEEEDEAEL